jgi:cytoskeleton protein RodZ
VTESNLQASADSGAAPVPVSAGALLRSAREAAGMTIDAVAQQLKLAPRQVRALEEGDYTHLPGRTFVRGFMRNYARLVRLDAEMVLGALPAGTATSNLDSPPLHATAPTIGELPTSESPRHGWTRWAIPLTLIAIIGATAAWEWLHPAADVPRTGANKETPAAPERGKRSTPEIIGTPLPNPVAPPPPAIVAPAPAAPAAAPDMASATVSSGAPAQAAQNPQQAEAPLATASAEAPLMLGFRDYSWTEVKDRSGRVLLSRMNPGGTTQAVSGSPPLNVIIGNAADVTLTWKGQRIDLAPYTRGNVARFTLE